MLDICTGKPCSTSDVQAYNAQEFSVLYQNLKTRVYHVLGCASYRATYLKLIHVLSYPTLYSQLNDIAL